MQLTNLLKNAIDKFPDCVATEHNGAVLSWKNIGDRVAKLANALIGIGTKSNDRIAILALNSDKYLESYFATWWAGAVIVPMNTRWSVQEICYSLNDSGAKILIVDDAFLPQVEAIKAKVTSLKEVVHFGKHKTQANIHSYEEMIANSDEISDANRSGEDLAGLFYTGGTTGFPKGVMLPHRALCFNARLGSHHFEFDYDSNYLHIVPMFHLVDLTSTLATISVGARQSFAAIFEPVKILNQIEKNKITHIAMVPTVLGMLLHDSNFDKTKLASLEYVLYGASPMSKGLLTEALKVLPNVKFIQGYGQTEMAPLVSILSDEYHVLEGSESGKTGSAGLPAMGVNIEIFDVYGSSVEVGEVGEVVASGEGVMLGYWNNLEATKSTLIDNKVHTGDAGYLDEDGFLYIVDRMKDMIISGGENIYCAEVENIISTMTAVQEVAVIGIPDEKWGEVVHAIVVKKDKDELSKDEILHYCRSKIAHYKCPTSIDLRETPLPTSAVGKVLKNALRKPYWENKNRSIN